MPRRAFFKIWHILKGMKNKSWIISRLVIITVVVGFAFFFISIKIDKETALPIDQPEPAYEGQLMAPTGCFEEANRKITAYLFPLKEPLQCVWHDEDAYFNLPYHFFVGALIATFATYFLQKRPSAKD